VHVSITTEGISLEGNLFSYNQIQSFGIIRMDGRPFLIRINTMSRSVGTVDIFLDPTIDIEALHTFLVSKIEEDPNAELSLIDHILL